MYDIHGRMIKQQNIRASSFSLSLNDGSAGIYYLAVYEENGQYITGEWVVKE